jgi:hypothetical protein
MPPTSQGRRPARRDTGTARPPASRAWRLAALALLGTSGCTVTAVAPTAADRNRERVIELEDEVDRLTRRMTELESALGVALKAPLRPDGQRIAEDILAAAPLAVTMDIGRFSGLIDGDSDGLPEAVRLHLQPRDGRGEVVQVAGRATLEALWVDEPGMSRALGRAELDPEQWRNAYRSGFMGTHYTLELPFEVGVLEPEAGGSILVRVSVADGLTGRTLAAESLYPIPR